MRREAVMIEQRGAKEQPNGVEKVRYMAKFDIKGVANQSRRHSD